MADCREKVRMCGRYFLEACRITLFFLCISYLMAQFATFFLLLTAKAPAQSPVVMRELFMICLLLAGSFGSYVGHKTTLQVFSILLFIYACSLTFLFVASIKAHPIDSIMKTYEAEMKADAPKYDWAKSQNSNASSASEAKNRWDSTPACCGLNGPEDWDKPEFGRPANYKQNLPSSCCIKGIKESRLCNVDLDAIFQEGCLEALKNISRRATITISCTLALYFLLSGLAAILFYFLPVGISEQGKDISGLMKVFASASDKRKTPVKSRA